MAAPVRFTVWGPAAPKGAVRPVPIRKGGTIVGSRLTEDGTRSRPWQALVRDAARQAVGSDAIPFPRETPLAVRALFWLPAPKSLPKRRPSAPVGQRVDLDKLVRGLLDAMTGVCYADDGQIVDVCARKAYAAPGTMPRVEVDVEAVALDAFPWARSCETVAPGREATA